MLLNHTAMPVGNNYDLNSANYSSLLLQSCQWIATLDLVIVIKSGNRTYQKQWRSRLRLRIQIGEGQMADINEMPTKAETIAAYLILAIMVGIMVVCGWMIQSSWSSWILY
jgi:hypothetical protein